VSWLIHLIRTALRDLASIVHAGYRNELASVSDPYPHTFVFGLPGGRICCVNWRRPIS
jgi:hypothetical protein